MDFAPPAPTLEPPNSPERRRRPRWGPWATLALSAPIILAVVLSQTLGAFMFLRWWRFAHPEQPIAFSTIASNGPVLGFSVVVSTPVVIGLLVLLVRLSRIPPREYLALKLPRWRDLGVGAGAIGGVLLMTGILAALTGQETPQFMADTFNSASAAGLLPLLLVAFVLLAPLQEELLFRGFLFRGFAPSFGLWPAIALTAALWAITHVQYQWFFVGEIFALGIMLGWLRARSGSTILTFALHALINGMALLEVAFISAD
jgi:membrane protease YdiL (CAAX protease family)